MNSELDKAINIVEEAGGIVIMQGDDELDQVMARESSQLNTEIENRKMKADYEERKEEAFKEFDAALGSKNFNFGTVEDICYENGIDLDDIEEYIYRYY